MNGIELITPNSRELQLKLFGYSKEITPIFLDEMIDKVMGIVELEKQRNEGLSISNRNCAYQVQEEEMVIGEFI